MKKLFPLIGLLLILGVDCGGLNCLEGPGLNGELMRLQKTNPCVAKSIYSAQLYEKQGYPVRIRQGIYRSRSFPAGKMVTGGRHAQAQVFYDGSWHSVVTNGEGTCFGPSELIRAEACSLDIYKRLYNVQ
ncbi:hypothetical protein KAR91_34530 [Candidatus Pacearchaeota archaeon]|nr:hypothetical protein [Candidatus Pacearchaeota archaeon]